MAPQQEKTFQKVWSEVESYEDLCAWIQEHDATIQQVYAPRHGYF